MCIDNISKLAKPLDDLLPTFASICTRGHVQEASRGGDGGLASEWVCQASGLVKQRI